MRLRIENINKIKEADIALNGLTVIVGGLLLKSSVVM